MLPVIAGSDPLFAHTYLRALTIFWLDCGLQKKRGELSTQSKLLDEMMEHQEKRDAHETKLAKMQARMACLSGASVEVKDG